MGCALGIGGNRATVSAVAPFPKTRVRPPDVATPAGAAPDAAGAVAPVRAEEPRRESGRVVRGTDEVVAGAQDLRLWGGDRADEQCGGARPAAGPAVAPGQLSI